MQAKSHSPGHRVGLGDAGDVREHAPELGHDVAVGFDQDDGVDHLSSSSAPGSRTTTLALPVPPTSAANAAASVSIGGNVL